MWNIVLHLTEILKNRTATNMYICQNRFNKNETTLRESRLNTSVYILIPSIFNIPFHPSHRVHTSVPVPVGTKDEVQLEVLGRGRTARAEARVVHATAAAATTGLLCLFCSFLWCNENS